MFTIYSGGGHINSSEIARREYDIELKQKGGSVFIRADISECGFAGQGTHGALRALAQRGTWDVKEPMLERGTWALFSYHIGRGTWEE